MLCSGKDLLLVMLVQIDKIVAVAGNPHQQVTIVVRGCLGIAQGLGVHNIKLNMMPVESKIAANEMHQAFNARWVFKNTGQKTLVQQGAAGFGLIHFAQ